MTKKIILTGGGTAGHVTPNIALIKPLEEAGWEVNYIGSKNGIEKTLIEPMNLPYYSVSTGKLRRYFSWQNFIDPFKLLFGVLKSTYLCYRLKPRVVFSKGGFVSLPVVIGAWLNRIPVILHESDFTPGLANRLSMPFAKKICLSFDETQKYVKQKNKIIVTGTPIRPALLQGDKQKGLAFTKLNSNKPVILIICGSLGSKKINQTVRQDLPDLLQKYNIVHLCGKNNIDPALEGENYKQYDYLNDNLADVFACSDLVISRAGANSLSELLALKKLHLLIPLSKKASRGDQIHNAKHFESIGLSHLLLEEDLNARNLSRAINKTFSEKNETEKALDAHSRKDSVSLITELINTI